jgi:hypothetical protein
VSDGSTSENGFTIMYGMPFDMKYVFAVRNPLMSTPCGRKFKTSEASRCQNENCDNCGISLDERADGVVNPVTGNFDNMCYIGSRQNSEVTHINDPIDGETLVGQYDECAKTVEKVLTHVAGDRVKMTVKCPRGSSLFAIDKTKLHDKPEYILGPGPPQVMSPNPSRSEAAGVVRGHFLACTACPHPTAASHHLLAHQNTAPDSPLQARVLAFLLPTSGGGQLPP